MMRCSAVASLLNVLRFADGNEIKLIYKFVKLSYCGKQLDGHEND
jgi:hypothetical protein